MNQRAIVNTVIKILSLMCSVILFSHTAQAQFGPDRKSNSQLLDGIVAVVDDDIITRRELNTAVSQTRRRLRQRSAQVPSPQALERQVLERLIIDQLQLQAAERSGIVIDDPTLEAGLARIAQRNSMSLDQLRRAVEREGFSYRDYREQIRSELLANRLRQRQIDSQIQVSEYELDNLLGSRAGRTDNTEYHIAQILIGLPQAATPEQIEAARSQAEQVLQELNAGADFNRLAAAVSAGRKALESGDLGWRSRAQLPAFLANIVPRLQPGQVSEPIRSPSGFHLVKLLDTRGGHAIATGNSATSQRDVARERLFRRKAEQEWELYLRQLRDEAYVEIRL